jgi:hypothetical protein
MLYQWKSDASKEIQFEGSAFITEVGGDPRVVTLPPDALQEFSIATGTYSAEFGNTGGGIERFTIKSGTNKFHGNLYEFLGNDKFDAKGFIQGERSIRRQNEYGGSIGGPVIKNKTFFFFNLNYYKFRRGPLTKLLRCQRLPLKRGSFSVKNPDGSLIQTTIRLQLDPTELEIHFLAISSPLVASARYPRISWLRFQINHSGIVNNYPASGNSGNDNRNYTFKIDHVQLQSQY